MSTEKKKIPECYSRSIESRMSEWLKLKEEREKLLTKLKDVNKRIKDIKNSDPHLMSCVGMMDKFEEKEAEDLPSEEDTVKQSNTKKRKTEEDAGAAGQGKKEGPRARLARAIVATVPKETDKTLQTKAKKP